MYRSERIVNCIQETHNGIKCCVKFGEDLTRDLAEQGRGISGVLCVLTFSVLLKVLLVKVNDVRKK
jgi:hypothetical protein